jgi:ribosomal protein S18 acetylase RimI-like enzyme
VARSLAAWFKPLDQMALAIDLRTHQGVVALGEANGTLPSEEKIIAFLTYHLLDLEGAELSWFGVLPSTQGEGIGQQLLSVLETMLAWQGIKLVEVSTVPADHEAAFAATNAFYKRNGFIVHQRDDDFYAVGRPRILLKKEIGRIKQMSNNAIPSNIQIFAVERQE